MRDFTPGVPAIVAERLKAQYFGAGEPRHPAGQRDPAQRAAPILPRRSSTAGSSHESHSSTPPKLEAHGVAPICKVLRSPPSSYTTMWPGGAIRPGCHPRAKRDMALKVAGPTRLRREQSVILRRRTQGIRGGNCSGKASKNMSLAALLSGSTDAGDGLARGDPRQADSSRQSATRPRLAIRSILRLVNRQFHAPAPNRLWVSDFTYVATWAGFVGMSPLSSTPMPAASSAGG